MFRIMDIDFPVRIVYPNILMKDSDKFFIFQVCLLLLFPVFLYAQETGKVFSLDEVLKKLHFPAGGTLYFRWDPFFQSGTIVVDEHYVSFRASYTQESSYALIDGQVAAVPAPFLKDGLIFFPEQFVTAINEILEKPVKTGFRVAAIIVDPGHGGKDPGSIGNHTINGAPLRVLEKDVTLNVAKLLHTRLSRAYPDKQILLTRDSDVTTSLDERVAQANKISLGTNESILFISIHANASFTKSARGYEVWYLDPQYRRNLVDPNQYTEIKEVIPILNAMMEEEFTVESIMIAESILQAMNTTLDSSLPSRGVKPEEWFVVRNARMPSVLVELGFITNEKDVLLLTNDDSVQKFSEALYTGIANFIRKFEQAGGFINIGE
ncbi:N-acetylmuramoyl-L-alanine amidase [Spirochaetia bacterium]|nr:N-acetylmuramoyl-L-alanine amidase [Spirochaetia bacterium]